MLMNLLYLLKSKLRQAVLLASILIFGLMSFSSAVVALSQDDLHSIYNDSVWYRVGGSISGGDIPCSPDIYGSGNLETIWNFVSGLNIGGKSLTPVQVAGVLGNFKVESGFSPTALNSSSGAYGIAQWLDNRLTFLKLWTSQQGLDYTSLEGQLRFLEQELKTYEKKSFDAVAQETSPSGAAKAWEENFERSGGAALGSRMSAAESIYKAYQAGKLGDKTFNPCGSEESGTVNTDGYAYPVAPLNKSAPRPTTGHAQPYAYDFMRPGGTAVFTVVSGTIGYVNTNYSMPGRPPVPGCTSINLYGGDGWKYWYGHLMNPLVKDGDPVAAGKKIAEVSNFGGYDCYGGGMHLHLDRGYPKGEGGGRGCCRGDETFIPFLQKLYDELPG